MLPGLLLRIARTYTTGFPDARGVSRLMRLVEQYSLPRLRPGTQLTVHTADGRHFTESVHEPWFFKLMMLGRRDPAETAIVEKLVSTGDTVLDIGANYGWYTTLMARLVGPSGRVHAFEAAPTTAELLRRNCEENNVMDRVVLNCIGLGSAPGTATIHVPKQHGGASLKPYYDEPTVKHDIKLTTLDAYTAERAPGPVSFVKLDVEGSEFAILKGARDLLGADAPPMWLTEVSRVTAAPFGYTPDDVMELMRGYGYCVCRVLEKPRGRLSPLSDVTQCEDGENVVYYPPHARLLIEKLMD